VIKAIFAVVALLVASASSVAADVPPLTGYVNDYARILSSQTVSDLERILSNYQAETTHQIAVLTVESLNGEPLEAFSLRVANEWGLGLKRHDNGVLVLLALREHAVRIELGKGMGRHVTDEQAGDTIDAMTPYFRAARYDDGVRVGIKRLMELCRAYELTAD